MNALSTKLAVFYNDNTEISTKV